jgi:hypothetical protein
MAKYVKSINGVISSGGLIPFTTTITCDGTTETYTETHSKNNTTPIGAIYVYDTVYSKWQPLDWAQGVLSNGANSVTINVMNYLTGNTNGIIYKLTIIA